MQVERKIQEEKKKADALIGALLAGLHIASTLQPDDRTGKLFVAEMNDCFVQLRHFALLYSKLHDGNLIDP